MIKARTRGLLDLLAALGAAWWIEKLITLEWAYRYCGVLDDGEAAAVFGFPLPYEQVNISASASASFIPWLYVVNLAVLTGGVFLILRPLSSRLRTSIPRLWNLTLGTAAAFLLFTAVTLEVFVISNGIWRPDSSFSGDLNYSELRPVAVRVLGRPRNCTASPFWFPEQNVRSIGNSKP